MLQSILNFLTLWPYLVMALMIGAGIWATWVIRQLSSKHSFTNYHKHQSGQVLRKLA